MTHDYEFQFESREVEVSPVRFYSSRAEVSGLAYLQAVAAVVVAVDLDK